VIEAKLQRLLLQRRLVIPGIPVDIDFWYVTIGTILGHSLCTAVAVMGGRLLASKISVRNGLIPSNGADDSYPWWSGFVSRVWGRLCIRGTFRRGVILISAQKARLPASKRFYFGRCG
jgi:hypothetical protein